VLVVDPEDAVRELIGEILVRDGYRVSLAKDADAVRAFAGAADRVDVIVLDATLSDTEEVTVAVQAQHKGIGLVMLFGQLKFMEEFHNRADQLA
jgi:DNA-binding NtrC family response regulator